MIKRSYFIILDKVGIPSFNGRAFDGFLFNYFKYHFESLEDTLE